MVTATMPKKKPNTDGRKNRFIPMSLGEMQSIRDRLQKLAGVFTAICDEMETGDISEIDVEGRAGVDAGLKNISTMARRSKGILAGGQIDVD